METSEKTLACRFACNFCIRTFSLRIKLNQHKRKRHAQQLQHMTGSGVKQFNGIPSSGVPDSDGDKLAITTTREDSADEVTTRDQVTLKDGAATSGNSRKYLNSRTSFTCCLCPQQFTILPDWFVHYRQSHLILEEKEGPAGTEDSPSVPSGDSCFHQTFDFNGNNPSEDRSGVESTAFSEIQRIMRLKLLLQNLNQKKSMTKGGQNIEANTELLSQESEPQKTCELGRNLDSFKAKKAYREERCQNCCKFRAFAARNNNNNVQWIDIKESSHCPHCPFKRLRSRKRSSSLRIPRKKYRRVGSTVVQNSGFQTTTISPAPITPASNDATSANTLQEVSPQRIEVTPPPLDINTEQDSIHPSENIVMQAQKLSSHKFGRAGRMKVHLRETHSEHENIDMTVNTKLDSYHPVDRSEFVQQNLEKSCDSPCSLRESQTLDRNVLSDYPCAENTNQLPTDPSLDDGLKRNSDSDTAEDQESLQDRINLSLSVEINGKFKCCLCSFTVRSRVGLHRHYNNCHPKESAVGEVNLEPDPTTRVSPYQQVTRMKKQRCESNDEDFPKLKGRTSSVGTRKISTSTDSPSQAGYPRRCAHCPKWLVSADAGKSHEQIHTPQSQLSTSVKSRGRITFNKIPKDSVKDTRGHPTLEDIGKNAKPELDVFQCNSHKKSLHFKSPPTPPLRKTPSQSDVRCPCLRTDGETCKKGQKRSGTIGGQHECIKRIQKRRSYKKSEHCSCTRGLESSGELNCHVHVCHEFSNDDTTICFSVRQNHNPATISTSNRKVRCNYRRKPGPISRSHQVSGRSTTIKKKLRCDYCWKYLSSRRTLQEHLRIHTGEKPIVCPLCTRAFRHDSNLKRHIQEVHDKITRSPIMLTYGKRKIRGRPLENTRTTEMFKLRKVGLGEDVDVPLDFQDVSPMPIFAKAPKHRKPYECLLCNEAFSRSETLKSHLRSWHKMVEDRADGLVSVIHSQFVLDEEAENARSRAGAQ